MSRVRADSFTNSSASGPPDFPNGLTVTGIITASTLNQNLSAGETIKIGTALTVTASGVNVPTGIVTASSFVGDGSGLSGVSAGLSSARAYTFNQIFS